jgi:hypothetical protein
MPGEGAPRRQPLDRRAVRRVRRLALNQVGAVLDGLRQLGKRDGARGDTADRDAATGDDEINRGGFETVGGKLEDFLAQGFGREEHR